MLTSRPELMELSCCGSTRAELSWAGLRRLLNVSQAADDQVEGERTPATCSGLLPVEAQGAGAGTGTGIQIQVLFVALTDDGRTCTGQRTYRYRYRYSTY